MGAHAHGESSMSEVVLGLAIWKLSIGRARHLGPRCLLSDRLSIEFLNMRGWLAHGDLGLESNSDFLAVAEHRVLFLPGARRFQISSECPA